MFWDLYCAAPERRETCEHSSEAKAFHDYVSFMLIVYVLSELCLEMITAMNLVIFNVQEKLMLPNFCIPLKLILTLYAAQESVLCRLAKVHP